MKVSIDKDGYIHIEAQSTAEKFAIKWHLKEHPIKGESGVIFHEEERTLDIADCGMSSQKALI